MPQSRHGDLSNMGGKIAIIVMGLTAQGRGLGATELESRRQAVENALTEAGLERSAIDGYIHASHEREDIRYLGLSPHFSWPVQSGGATAPSTFAIAAGAILSGQAEMVACAYGMAPFTTLPGTERRSLGAFGWLSEPNRHGGRRQCSCFTCALAYGSLRHHQPAPRGRCCAASPARASPSRRHRLRPADHTRRPPSLADGGRSFPHARLLPRHQWGCRFPANKCCACEKNAVGAPHLHPGHGLRP